MSCVIGCILSFCSLWGVELAIFRNLIVLYGSFVAILASLVWGYYEGGFEPWIVALFGVVGIAINWPLGSKVRSPRALTPTQKLAAREKWRPIFEAYFLERAKNNYRGDVIVHDVDRVDDYPDTSDEEEGISSWFRVGLMDTYHRGILLGLQWTNIVEEQGKWVEVEGEKPEGHITVMLLGEVPYESIEQVNFDGDQYYNKPHIFCHFEFNGEPYERMFYGEEFRLDPGFPYHYREIAQYERRAPKHSIWKRINAAARRWLNN